METSVLTLVASWGEEVGRQCGEGYEKGGPALGAEDVDVTQRAGNRGSDFLDGGGS